MQRLGGVPVRPNPEAIRSFDGEQVRKRLELLRYLVVARVHAFTVVIAGSHDNKDLRPGGDRRGR